MSGSHTIIIDGIWGRPRRWIPLRDALEEHVGSAEIWEYDSSGCVRFDELGQQLVQRGRGIGRDVNLVAFSMGGLIARAARSADPSLPIRRAVFLNSPHRGSLMAYLLPLRGVRQMRPASDFIKQINAEGWPVPTLVVWNPLDTMVVPGTWTRLHGASETALCRVPIHLWPIWSKNLRRRIINFLKMPHRI